MNGVLSKLFTTLTPEQCLFYSEWHGVAAIPDAYPKLPYQTVVISRTPFTENQHVVGDLPARDRLRIHAVVDAVQRRLQKICSQEKRALTHTEGYAVPLDPHILVYQSPERKSGKYLYEGQVIDWSPERTIAALAVLGSDADSLNIELDRIDRAFPLADTLGL